MTAADLARFTLGSLGGARLRSGLTLLAMAIGVASVVVLTGLGEAARRYVTGQFAALGTHLLIVLPGRSETTGGPPPILGEVPRDLTIDDALALLRSRAVRRVAPIAVGAAPVSHGPYEREVTIIGSTADFAPIRRLRMASGRFLPPRDPHRPSAVAVIGGTVRRELFRGENPLGRWIRIGDRRYRVIGVLASSGRALGLDLDEMVVIPVASALSLFDTSSLFRILVEARGRDAIPAARRAVVEIIRERHDGEDDVTVITQDAVLATFDRILRTMTLAVAGIAAVSLAVAGVLVMNVMLVSVTQRTEEVGLLKALGSPPGQILRLFLAEAAALSLLGAAAGTALGYAGAALVHRLYPILDTVPPVWAPAAAAGIALAAGLLFGVAPARRAAALDPVAALGRR
ncbi:MAG: ABC transporter permease [Acidobacteria bacterium]|nr:MAG: ABC transporter permease [Acidobacteriota bacterium]